MKIIELKSLDEIYNKVSEYKEKNYFFIWEFLKELDSSFDELIIILEKEWKQILLKTKNKTNDILPKISDIYYAAYNFENEIYDYYGKKISWDKSHILRLHLDKKDYFPKRKLAKPTIKEKKEFVFTETKWEWNVKVQVWPIHAWIIPPGHFRFTCDWENTLNLDIQLGWTHRWVEDYFERENNLEKLLDASEDIVWDSRIAYSINFIKLIEQASNISVSKNVKEERIIALELERIYNHLWTIWAMLNDVGQWFLLNGFLSIREEILKLLDNVYGSRTLKWVIWIWNNKINLDSGKVNLILETLNNIKIRFEELYLLWKESAWIYDRFKDTWIVHKSTAKIHGAVWISAKASRIYRDARVFDEYYKNIKFKKITWEQWDVFDRYIVRWEEIFQSMEIIQNILKKHNLIKKWCKNTQIKLKNWEYTALTEWQRWETFMYMEIKNNEISYFKIKDPSFVNWTLLEYAVLNNIIADFPICNKSFDHSYSWFDL